MKKFLLALMALPLMMSLASCHDDDELPDVNINVTYKNAVVVDHQVYVVQGQEFGIESIVTTAAQEGKNATNGAVSYWLNGIPVGTTDVQPFAITLAPEWTQETGSFYIEFVMPVYEEGCALATAYARVKVNVVASADDIPSPSDGEAPATGQTLDHKLNDK